MNEIMSNLELPENGKIARHILSIEGWAFSKHREDLIIEIYIDEKLRCKGRSAFPRFDVYKKYPYENAYTSGFKARITIGELKDGLHVVKVKALTSENEKLIGEVNVIKNSSKIVDGSVLDEFVALGGIGQNNLTQRVPQQFFENFIKVGKLQPKHKVLDVGSGMGRLALPLTRYLRQGSKYYGIDNVKVTIDYCQKNISSRFSNFNFIYADIFNQFYNPKGKYEASNYKFPFEDQFFDFVYLTSVFTHLILEDLKNYLHEVSRVLKSGGRSYITFFLLNQKTLKQIESGLSKRNFKYQFNGFRSDVEKVPERVLAYEESLIRKLYDECNLMIEEPIYYGTWSGLEKTLETQDVILGVKT